MALGFSGSNGGIASNPKQVSAKKIDSDVFYRNFPMEVSYFINNVCNLNCSHCYVGYNNASDTLSYAEWVGVFDKLISTGARTFGIVGKEPLLSWKDTKKLLEYFRNRRSEISRLRFGFVTNGLLLDRTKIFELETISPSYIDISIDGDGEAHDKIRGVGSYKALMENLTLLSKSKLRNKIFISFTLNTVNSSSIPALIYMANRLGFKNILISPYVSKKNGDNLFISNDKIISVIQKLLDNRLVNFNEHKGLSIYFKNDFSTTNELTRLLITHKIINKKKLLIDEYGVIFNEHVFTNNNKIYFNYMPWDTSYTQAIRISHDGFVGNCLDMFYEDYPLRAIGNVLKRDITEILHVNKHRVAS